MCTSNTIAQQDISAWHIKCSPKPKNLELCLVLFVQGYACTLCQADTLGRVHGKSGIQLCRCIAQPSYT